MRNRNINSYHYRIISGELNYFKNLGIITDEQFDQMIKSYNLSKKLNFISILLIIGSILIGLGIISFVASNWYGIGNISKIAIILIFLIFSQFLSYYFQNKSNAASRALLYLTILIFGAGLFLIAQIFKISDHSSFLLLLWTIGSLVMTFVFKETGLFLLTNGLLFTFISNSMNTSNLINILSSLIILICIYLYYYKTNNHTILFCTAIIPSIMYILYLLNLINADNFINAAVILAIGLLLYYIPQFKNFLIKTEATIIYSISALVLTEAPIWENVTGKNYSTLSAVIFSIIFLIFLLYQTKQDNIAALVFVGITILKLYSSTFYNLMPKSLFFITFGLIIFIFGYYFEKKVKLNIGSDNNEK